MPDMIQPWPELELSLPKFPVIGICGCSCVVEVPEFWNDDVTKLFVELAAEERADPVTLAAEVRAEPVLEAAALTEDRMFPMKSLLEGATSGTDIVKVSAFVGFSAALAAITGVFCEEVPPMTGPSNKPSSKEYDDGGGGGPVGICTVGSPTANIPAP